MINYQTLMETEIASLKGKPNLLLHSCCAPCSTHVISILENYFNLTIYYYNPNIEPIEEYLKRKEEQIKYANIKNIKVIDCDYENELYKSHTSSLENEKEGGARCQKCFYLRLEKTAQYAEKNNFEYFTTTLTVSPHKNSQILNEIGLSLEQKYNVRYLVADFKKKEGYKNSIILAKKHDLYRQEYCGCQASNAHNS